MRIIGLVIVANERENPFAKTRRVFHDRIMTDILKRLDACCRADSTHPKHGFFVLGKIILTDQ